MEDNNKDVAEKARKLGWVPQDEWKGDPEQWRDAEEFVERGENILPIVKDRLTKTQKEVEELKRQLRTSSDITNKQIEEIKKQEFERAKAAYEAQLRDLGKEGFQAAQEGDFDKYHQIEQQKTKLAPPKEPELPNKQDQQSSVFEEWKKENDWYESDRTATLLANGIAGELDAKIKSGEHEQLTEDAFYKKVEELVKKELPQKFENPNRNTPGMTEGTGHAKTVSKKKGYNDLPSSAKTQLKRDEENFKTKGWEFDRDAWVNTYFEED